MNFNNDLDEASLRLVTKKHNAFIGSILYSLNIVPSKQVETVTLDTDKETISINPEYFHSLNVEERASVLAHETYHYALMHSIRRGNRNEKIWQKACEETVNDLLINSGFTLPKGTEVNNKYEKWSTEEVYEDLLKNSKEEEEEEQGQPSQGGLDQDLLFGESSDSTSTANQEVTAKISSKLMNANLAEEMASGSSMDAGKSGYAFKKLFEEIKRGKLQWNVILQEYIDEKTQGEPSYENFNRRYIQYDLYLPSNLTTCAIERIAIACDISGSVSEQQLVAFLKEMKLIKDTFSPEYLDVVAFNHNIQSVTTFDKEDEFTKVDMYIGGGTDLEPVFNYYANPKHKPNFLIVFSDLECTPIISKPDYDVIWICIDNPNAEVNFGKIIHINTKDLINESN